MGKILCKFCSCLCRCCCVAMPQNSIGVLPKKKLKVLLLGQQGSGKSEIAHFLTHKQREDFEPTNGVHSYEVKGEEVDCSLTEIGGNEDMQRIWHHYYVGSMAIIYCFDMSCNYEELQKSFELLDKVLQERYARGKAILLVATKADLVDESVQLYDIENTFKLHQIANSAGSSIKLCVFDRRTEAQESTTNLRCGFNWLIRHLLENYDVLQMRLNCDKNMKNWETQRDNLVAKGKLNLSEYHRFPMAANRHGFWRFSHKRLPFRRPRTAPAKISFVTASSPQPAYNHDVPSSAAALSDSPSKVPNGVLPHGDVVTEL